MNTRVLFVKAPTGWVDGSSFEIVEAPIPEPGPQDVVVRNIYVSVDPYLRGRMGSGGDKPVAPAMTFGEPMVSRVVSEVVASQHPRWTVGDLVWGFFGWEQYTVVPRGEGLRRVRPEMGPIRSNISVMGMPGLTAWVGIFNIGKPTPGETVFISSAAGAVGSVAGQLAKLAGARVVGAAGGPAKVAHVVETLGFDACIDYKAADVLVDAVAEACPDGIDIYFENVGGEMLEAALANLNPFARIPVCGMISGYNALTDPGVKGIAAILRSRATMTGYSIYDHMGDFETFQSRMSRLLADGNVVFHHDIVEGIEHAPEAFIGMLRGDAMGKRLVRAGTDPTT